MTSFEKKPLIIISGPTATGKSAVGIRLAKDLGGEIISADSMQVYKLMDIGTAKVTEEEMSGIPHHMIDVCDPKCSYSIADYKVAAKEVINDIHSRGKVPIVVGGTCFYIHALLYDTDFDEIESDGSIREALENELKEKGAYALHEKLRSIDPDAADAIHMNNAKRVIRAIEFYELNGYPISEHNRTESEKDSPYNFVYFALNRNREELYAAIDERVDRMMDAGLLDEIEALKKHGCNETHISMQGIGYKELFNYENLDEAIYDIKNNSHHYTKKQVTWLKREKDVIWIDSPVSEEDYRWMLKKSTEILE